MRSLCIHSMSKHHLQRILEEPGKDDHRGSEDTDEEDMGGRVTSGHREKGY